MKAYFHTLGCKVNQYETRAMAALLEDAGFETAEYSPDTPNIGRNILVINSCSVTGESDRKMRQFMRRCRRQNPEAIILLSGCMPQAYPDKASTLSDADIVTGNAKRADIVSMIRAHLETGERIVDIPKHTPDCEPLSIKKFEGRTRAYLKIEDGCNQFCTYCIIPYARGRVRSKPLADIKDEAQKLADAGYTELVLVGINLTAYGRDCGLTLADAVEAVCAIDGLRRVRLGSLEPEDMTDDVIERMAKLPKLCPQFHLSLQSGCDATLKRMGRRYDTALYRHICHQLKAAFTDCALTSDVMVGFPGETEEDFETSLKFVKEIGFTKIHVFPYSKRPGTPAAVAPNQVTRQQKAERSRRMIAAGEQSAEQFFRDYVGRELEVLCETPCPDGTTDGYTANYTPVHVAGLHTAGIFVTAVVDRVENGVCYAHVKA